MINQMILRRSLFHWPLLGLWPQKSNNLLLDYLVAKPFNGWHVIYLSINLAGRTQKWSWLTTNDETWFERFDINTIDLDAPVWTSWYKNIKSFPAFFDNDRIGWSRCIDYIEMERLIRHIDNPFVYVLNPKNRPDLVGIKISEVKQTKLVFHVIKEQENFTLKEQLEKIEVPL